MPHFVNIYEGWPLKTEFIYKKLCINSYMFQLQSPSKYSPVDAIHIPRFFFSTAQNSFWTHWFWCLLVLLPFFVSSLPHPQNICIWGLFLLGQTKKSCSGQDWGMRRVGHRSHGIFGQNSWTHSAVWAGALVNRPSWNGQTHWKSL